MSAPSTSASAENAKASSSGLIFHLHPLVLINVSDHFVRTRANNNQTDTRVFGCLLGQQNGRDVSISNSFELIVQDGMDGPSIDEQFLTRKQEQYKQTFSDLDIVGWYSTGASTDATDMVLHRKIMELNESPVYLLLDTSISLHHKELPVSLHESELYNVGGSQQFIFVRAEYSIQTSEAERIGVNQVAKVAPSGNDSASDEVSAHYANMVSAIKMLNSRVAGLHTVVRLMAEGSIPVHHGTLREASGLLKRLPAINSTGFQGEFVTEFNDALLAILMSSITSGSNTLLDIVDKCNVAYSRP